MPSLTSCCCISARLVFFQEPRVEVGFRGVTGTLHSESRGNQIPFNTSILNKQNISTGESITPYFADTGEITLFVLPACLGENSSLILGLAIWYEPVNKLCHPGL